MAKNKICSFHPLQPEFSLCGDAFDAPDTEDDVEPFELASNGETVTCENCREAIKAIRDSYPRGYKYVDKR